MWYLKQRYLEGEGDGGTPGAGPTEGSEPPAGEGATRPAEIPEKFWDAAAGKPRVTELAKSYTELERVHSAGKDALRSTVEQEIAAKLREGLPETPSGYALPEAQALGLAEGVDVKFIDDDPMLAFFRETAHKHHIPTDVFNQGVKLYVQQQLAGTDPAEELKKLGETGPQRMESVRSILKARLSAEEMEGLEPAMIDAASFVSVEKLLQSTGLLKAAPSNPGGGGEGTGGDTRESLEKLMEDPRYHHPVKRDPAYIADVQARFAKLFPGKRRVSHG